jgi:hypothetical protein
MVGGTRVSGSITKCMVQESYSGPMVAVTMVILKEIRSRGRAPLAGRMDASMKGLGKMVGKKV